MGQLRIGLGQVVGAGGGQSTFDALDRGDPGRFGEGVDLRIVPGRIDLGDARGVRRRPVALPAIGAVSHHTTLRYATAHDGVAGCLSAGLFARRDRV